MSRPPKLNERCIAATGRTMANYFDACIGSNMSLRAMARHIGVSPGTIGNWARKTGRTWDTLPTDNSKTYGFYWRGVFDTQRGHCERHGVKYETVKAMRFRYEISFADALEIAVGKIGQVKAHKNVKAWIASHGVNVSTVYQIATRHGITRDQALDVAIARAKARGRI